ncbi:MAG TPA: hopanoid-associated sugar epimerase [Frankiaceae bacterium]|nr:hopanoid-associated sugar epimerase [Frankiaceae bacterium]
MSLTIEAGDRVVVSGAAGFIGAAVVRALLARGARVVALVEPGADERNLDGLDVERLRVDVRDADAVTAACTGARFVFHLAAMYRFWSRRPQDFYDVNVGGTRNVIRAARAASCERVIYTSTVGVLGLDGAAAGRPADETCYADVAHLFGLYKRTKYVAEHEVLREAAQGAPVSLVLPTFPLGPADRRPTPTGKVVVEFLNGRMPAFVDTTFNVVHVDDLAAGHLLALEGGRVGRSYIVGGENLPMREFLAVLAKSTGLPAPTKRVPRGVALGVGALSQLVEGRILRREPSVALEAARMSTTNMMFSDERARSELGYAPRPAAQAIADSARWFVENGYVEAKRLDRISLSG